MLITSRLWIAAANQSYRPAFVVPPEQYALANGIKIIGWQNNGAVLLVRTDQWQVGSDALDNEGIFAIDAKSGIVYKPDLNEIARHVKSDRCFIHIRDAALAPGRSVKIVVQLQIKTAHEPDEAPENAPPSTVVTTPNRAGALISPPASYLSFLVRRRLLVPFSLSRRYSCCSRCFQAAWEIVGFSVHRKNLEDRILTN